MHYEETKFANFKVVGLLAVEKEAKYIGNHHCYRQKNITQKFTLFFIRTSKFGL